MRNNMANGRIANLKPLSKVGLREFSRSVYGSYGLNIFNSQFRRWISFSRKLPTFRQHIINIFSGCPQPKMFRIYASWNIAFMKDAKAFRNLTIFKFPRYPVGTYTQFINPKFSISFCGQRASPQPAGRSLFYADIKSAFHANSTAYFKDFFSTFRTGFFGRLIPHGKLILSRAIPRTINVVAGFLLVLIVTLPVFGGVKYSFSDPKLNDEWDNNYKEHTYPNWVNAHGSSATITYLNVSTMTVGQLNASSGTIKSFMVVGGDGSTVAPFGRIGESTTVIKGLTTITTNVLTDLNSFVLGPGTWFISGTVAFHISTGTNDQAIGMIHTVAGNDFTGNLPGQNRSDTLAFSNVLDGSVAIAYIVTPTSNTTYYLKAYLLGAGTLQAAGQMQAIRIF